MKSLYVFKIDLQTVSSLYVQDANSYFTGYFTSRPSFKYHERQSNSLLQSAKQVNAISGSRRQSESVFPLADAMGIAQHHDAVTGTSRSPVDRDYHFRLT